MVASVVALLVVILISLSSLPMLELHVFLTHMENPKEQVDLERHTKWSVLQFISYSNKLLEITYFHL